MSLRTPKAKYCIRISYDRAIKGLGSEFTFTGNNIDDLKSIAEKQMKSNGVKKAYIRISENKATYPSFDWQEVESYNISL